MLNRKLKKFISNYSEKASFGEQTIINDNFFKENVDFLFFIKAFAKEFNVDISNFNYTDYQTETIQNHQEQRPLTIGDLNKAISLGSLDKYTIASEGFETKFRPDITLKGVLIGIIITIGATILLCLVAFFS